MKFAILRSDVKMLLASMSRNSLVPNKEMGSASPSHESGLMPLGLHVLMLPLEAPSALGRGVFREDGGRN